MIPACIFPHQHQQFWSCSAVDNILFKYFINLRFLRIFSNYQHWNYLPYSIFKLSTSGCLALIWLRLCCQTANFKITNTRTSCRFFNSSTIIQDFWPCSGVDFGGGLWRTRLTRIGASPMLNLNTSRWEILGKASIQKHRKNCEGCPGHSLIVNHYSSMS